jgi:hypothetical protein
MALDTKIWYSQRVGSSSHTLIKEKLMSEPRTCYLPHMTALFCTGVERLGLVKALQRHGPDIVVSDMTGLEGRR